MSYRITDLILGSWMTLLEHVVVPMLGGRLTLSGTLEKWPLYWAAWDMTACSLLVWITRTGPTDFVAILQKWYGREVLT